MVFKRVLKGIGRLMLTTAVMCGVGLFLCSSEVKADPTLTITSTSNTNLTDNRFVLGVNNSGGTNITVTKIDFYKSNSSGTLSDPISSVSLDSDNTISAGDSDGKINITNMQFIEGYSGSDTGNVSIAGVSVTYSVDGGSDETKTVSPTPAVTTAPIYKVSAAKASSYDEVVYEPTFKYTVGGRENCQFGYKDETYKIEDVNTNVSHYYMLAKLVNNDPIEFNADDADWKDCETNSLITPTTPPTIESADVIYKVAYLPKVKEQKLVVTGSSNSGSTLSPTGLNIVSNSINGNTTLTYEVVSFENENENAQKNTIIGHYKPAQSIIEKSGMADISFASSGSNGCNVTMKLSDIGITGKVKVKLAIKLGNDIEVASVELPITLSAVTATDFELQSDTVTLMAGESKDVSIIKGILPAGANQNLENYTGSATVTSGNNLIETCTYNNTGGNKTVGTITLKTSSGVTSGTATVKIALNDTTNSTPLGTKEFKVKIISFDKEKTISSINKNNKNYITYNKDKGYSLDIKQLIIDNAKDTSDSTVTITKDQIKAVSVGGSSCTDGIWKPSEAATNKEVKCKVNGVQIDGIRVSAYPMPTATYSSSNRTLSVKIPTKVATAYSDDNNIRQSKGFKLILEDSSGNTLYEYTDSKYQSVLSSSSESTVTYTVPAADIEGMVTSAASNGKFSADTTSVKFKVIPMGYKQSSTSDETIKAKDEIAGKTDAVTVYKVSASGTNFTSSAAYGLDGQTVSITATPNSGYSFKQWSDGNTSNPRQVKVSASGTRSFQAVAGDRVANSTGAGGTDNSELYDDVPKTAESNSAIWLIVFMVFAVMGTTYALYLQLRAANSKHDR